MRDFPAMMRTRHRVAATLAALVVAGAGTGVILSATSRSAVSDLGPCHGVRVASQPKRFGWWMHPGERFSREWLCGHFGAPRVVAHTRGGLVWRYGPPESTGLRFVRTPDGRFSPA